MKFFILKKSTLLHLRIPFSFFLLPVYLFAISILEDINTVNALLAFVILHFLVYPASNGFNSYYDKDEESIGGLEDPPPVSRELLYFSLAMDALALILAIFVNWSFVLMVFIFGMVSKAYSHDKIRLKKYPILGWLTASFFQGFFTFLAVVVAAKNISIVEVWQWQWVVPALLSTLLLMGFYPMTQIYQHDEDGRRGDLTISRLLGVMGTFYFTAFVFLIADLGFLYFFLEYYSFIYFLDFQLFLLVPVSYFIYWLVKSRKNISRVNYRSTMMLNYLSAGSMNAFFLIFGILTH